MRPLLPLLPKPSRYAGIEDNACRKNPEDVRLRVALAFPDTYDVGMSYLGQKILYNIVNSEPRWWAERVMAPEKEAAEILRAHNTPLATLESDTPLGNMHCLSFSITHELCYTNVLYMLDLAGIPLRTADRPKSLTQCPLVIAGGGALLSAEPLTPFVDIMVLGDGEESLPDVLRMLEKALDQGWTRDEMLLQSRTIPGVYVPSLFQQEFDAAGAPIFPLKPLRDDYQRPTRRIVADLNNAAYPTRQVVPVGAVHNRLSLEIARGCTRGCRFCHAGMVYRPVRERSLDNINELLTKCLNETGFDRCMVFCNTKGNTERITKFLQMRGIDAQCIHGDIPQKKREQVMDLFRKGKLRVFVSTDVAARGIDVDDVDIVFNCDIPDENQDYVHRIGRTGRAKRQGVAVSFVADFPSKIRIDDIAKNTRNEILPVKFDENGSLTMA